MATDKNTLKNWFKTGLKPTQLQFWAWLDSYFHKDEQIPQNSVSGLQQVLNGKAEKAQLEAHLSDPNAHLELMSGTEKKENKGIAGGYAPLDEFSKIAHQYLNIVNNLESGGASAMLSAEQGVVLQNQINSINALLSSDNVNLDTVQEIVDAIESLQNTAGTVLVNDLTTGGATKALTAEMGKVLNEIKLTATLATDPETQITSAVTEDNKVVSRLKLFNWWNWVKTQQQIITGNWDFRAVLKLTSPGSIQAPPSSGIYPNVYIDNSNVDLRLSANDSISFGTSTTGSIRYRRSGFQSNIVQNPLTLSRIIYYPDASGTVLLKETLTSLEISQFQKNGTLPMYIRVNNFTSDVLEDLRIILGSGTNIPYFQRCILANANKGGGMWERAVSTVKLNNTNVAVSSLAINTGVLMQISDSLLFTWAVDTQSSKTGALVSELINGDSVKDVDDKTANNFRITFEVSYSAGAGDGTLELSILNPSLLVVDQSTETINIDGRGATKKRVVFNLRAVKTQDNNTGYRLRLNNGSKEISEYRLLNILRTNN